MDFVPPCLSPRKSYLTNSQDNQTDGRSSGCLSGAQLHRPSVCQARALLSTLQRRCERRSRYFLIVLKPGQDMQAPTCVWPSCSCGGSPPPGGLSDVASAFAVMKAFGFVVGH